ncbi:PAS domain-containing protein [Nitrincola sp. A-D6]|uniref:PAS domain-containing protein n=1 Tax=Nitrincola sp. A-D6 TaxID=1545442 RepID=UPI00190F560C|nr:hypothetical protein [Nitrincola sp. A-D6]
MSLSFSDDNLLKASLEAISDAILITDAQLDFPGPYIIYANPAFCNSPAILSPNFKARRRGYFKAQTPTMTCCKH